MRAFDTTHDCSKAAAGLLAAGYDTVIRYYCRPDITWKKLRPKEAIAIARAGLQLAVVYQDAQDSVASFSKARGVRAGGNALDYAQSMIFQPEGSAIYFAVDYDASQADLKAAIVPFFEGVAKAFDAGGAPRPYRIGVYGSGRVCHSLLAGGHADLAWLAQSTGYADYKPFLASNDWALSQRKATIVAGIAGDPDDVNPAIPDFGAFVPEVAAMAALIPPSPVAPGGSVYRVIAASGLRLRAVPDAGGEVIGMLAPQTHIAVLGRSGDWALIDSTGDGLADGYAFAGYLAAA